MDLSEIGPNFFVSSQIKLEQLEALNEMGIKTIICNRPDDEDIGQVHFKEIAKMALNYDIQCYYLPIIPPHITQADIQQMKEILQDASYPILAYCRSGTRSSYLYNFAKNMV